jgi:hypothetical protein
LTIAHASFPDRQPSFELKNVARIYSILCTYHQSDQCSYPLLVGILIFKEHCPESAMKGNPGSASPIEAPPIRRTKGSGSATQYAQLSAVTFQSLWTFGSRG